MFRPISIGNVSGATGDRPDAMLKMLTGITPVDAIVGDWLSEMNLSWRALDYMKDPTKGYEKPFLISFEMAAKAFVSKDVKMVVNAGALNPKQLASKVQEILAATPHPGKTKTVAWIEGDDILKFCQTYPHQVTHLHDRSTLQTWSKRPIVAANAYIGAWGIVKALEEGADIVITGRVTDASPTIGLAAWWHHWRFDDFDKLAHALATGHLIECGPYVTGGNFPGFKRLMPKYFDLSHPVAEISYDGTSIITKQAEQNGLVSVETVKTQFVYELQGPFYFNPDVIADFTNISFSAVGDNRVRVSGVKGLPAPPLLKAAVQARGGYQAELALHPAGLDIREKFESIKEMGNLILKEDIKDGNFTTLQYQLYGSVPDDPQSLAEATTYIRFFVQADSAETVQRAITLFISNCLAAFPGCTPNMDSRSGQPKPILEFWPGLVPRSVVQQIVHFANRSFNVSEQIPLLQPAAVPKQLSYEPTSPVPLSDFGPTVRAPLGHIVYARSGDKGPNVNVGFFCGEKTPRENDSHWDWLRSFLTISRLQALLGNDSAKAAEIERCEFPQLRAVHFVIHGILGTGVGTTSELDALGKNVAEFLRARQVDIPSQFYDPKAKI